MRLNRAACVAASMMLPVSAAAVPLAPVYTTIFTDAVTGDSPNPIVFAGSAYWAIDAGADSYQNNVYERPTTQTFIGVGGGQFGAAEYFGNLDIVSARTGFDSRYVYVAIDMFSTDHQLTNGSSTNEGLVYRYGFQLGDPDSDGAGGFLLTVDQPAPLGTSYQLLKNEGFEDTNSDVGGAGGRSVTKDDGDVAGDGFDSKLIGDGRILFGPNEGADVLFSRIHPLDPTIVEFAVDYTILGLDPVHLSTLSFEAIKGGPKDPQSYLWNDKYTAGEAGTPYSTAGTQNINELDTLQGGAVEPIPEPSTMFLLGAGLAGAFGLRRRRSTKA